MVFLPDLRPGAAVHIGHLVWDHGPSDHRPGAVVPIYRVKGGKFVLVKAVDLKAKWAKQWEAEWLGY